MAEWGTGTVNPEDKIISCGDFFPDISRKEFFDVYRIPTDIPVATIDVHLYQGMINVKRALGVFRSEKELAGVMSLEAVPQDLIDGTGELVVLWRRAVYCEAKAEILKETQSVDRREIAENAAKTSAETEEKYREFAQDAIRMIVGMGRVSIDLI